MIFPRPAFYLWPGSSPWMGGETPPLDPPPAPTGLRLVEATTSSVLVDWEDGGWIGLFSIQQSPAGLDWEIEFAVTNKPALISGLAAGVLYNFRIQATNGQLSSGWSNILAVATQAPPPPPPEVPVSLAIVARSDESFTVGWSGGLWAAEFFAECQVETDPMASPLSVVTLSQSFTLHGLSPDTSYLVRVRSSNVSGLSPYSDTLTVTTDSPWLGPVWGGGGAGIASSGELGNPVAGDVLTVSSMDCSGYPALSFGYEWQSFDVGGWWVPAGSDAAFAVPETAVNGQRWRCLVTANNAKGPAAVCTSNETGAFAGVE